MEKLPEAAMNISSAVARGNHVEGPRRRARFSSRQRGERSLWALRRELHHVLLNASDCCASYITLASG